MSFYKICNDNHLYRVFGGKKGSLTIPYLDGYHCGYDLGTVIGDNIFAPQYMYIVDVVWANGYGSLNPKTPGWVIFADVQINNKPYNLNFGHVNPLVKKGQEVPGGTKIGTVASFYNGLDQKGNKIILPHVHIGCHEGNGIPESPWGYTKTIEGMKGWINPVSLGLC